jgi:anaerobic ribonucleoside-triphosphate reductase
VDFDWKTLWYSLRETRTELSALKVSGSERVMDDMLQYLLSYNGLQKLEITHLQMDHQHEEDKLAETFWEKIVPHVRATLDTLAITTSYEGNLCYGPSAAAALTQCSFFKDLTLSVGTVSTSWADEIFSQARNDRRVGFLA